MVGSSGLSVDCQLNRFKSPRQKLVGDMQCVLLSSHFLLFSRMDWLVPVWITLYPWAWLRSVQ